MRMKLGAMGVSIVIGLLLTLTIVLQTPVGSMPLGV